MYRYCFILLVVATGGARATDGDEVDAHNHKGLFEAVDSLMVYIIVTCTVLAVVQGVRIGGR